ncbi:hypothetical protein [Actinomadura sp. DC4]|nr:hypothetical protein [Actinomadura sp. DC4]MDN3360170.1 hypothetical protein [Actinomadura sp. DC4]
MTATIDKIAWIHLEDGRILSTRSRGKDVCYLFDHLHRTGRLR